MHAKNIKGVINGKTSASPTRENVTSIRLTTHERNEMEEVSATLGFKSLGDYLRHLHNVSMTPMRKQREQLHGRDFGKLNVAHKTSLGKILQGNSLEYLHHAAKPESVNVIMTSPPFGLVRKKTYGMRMPPNTVSGFGLSQKDFIES